MLAALILLLALSMPAEGRPLGAQDDARTAASSSSLTGEWSGRLGPLRGVQIDFGEGGVCSRDGEAGNWAAGPAADALTIRWPGETWAATYSVRGSRLTLTIDGRRSILRSVAPAAPAVSVSPFVGTFSGGSVRLVLRDASPGMEGSLALEGTVHPCRAVEFEGRLLCAIRRAGAPSDDVFALRATKGGSLAMARSGRPIELLREAAPAALSGPPALSAVAAGPLKRYEDPKGHFSFDLPKDWTVRDLGGGELMINPGFRATDTLDALLVVTVGRLEPGEIGRTPAALLDAGERDMRRAWKQQGVTLRRAARKALPVRVGAMVGAHLDWKGSLANGSPVDAWIGSVSKDGAYVTVTAITVEPRTKEFLPAAKGMLLSLTFEPPARNLKVEQQLAGRRVSYSESTDGNFFAVTVDLFADGTLLQKVMLSGKLGLGSVGGDTGDYGTYSVVGDTLLLRVNGEEEMVPLVVRGGELIGVDRSGSKYALR